MKELLRKLCDVYGPSGHEEQIREVLVAEIEELVDEYRVDALGNLIAVRHSTIDTTDNAHKVMLAAHMDEIGIVVTHIDEKGFLRFTAVGGVHAYNLLGSRVIFHNGAQGVFGRETKRSSGSGLDFRKLFLDVGATSRDDVPVEVGDAAAFRQQFNDLGERLLAPNFDDRVGCAVVVQTLRELKDSPHEIFAAFTVQEEVGLRGATTSAYGIAPNIALAVDVTLTGDTPEAHPMSVSLGKGPAIKVMDRRFLAHPGVKDWLVSVAKSRDIPYQLEVLEFGTTDANAIQITREGIAAGAVSIPSRYVHAPSQMIDYADVQNAVSLLVACLSDSIEL